MNILGNSIKSIRKSKGMTQRELSEMTGFKQNTISNHENGNRQLDETDIRTYAKALNISPQELFDMAGVSTPTPTPQVLHLDRELKEPRHAEWISYGDKLLDQQNTVENSKNTVDEPITYYTYNYYDQPASAGTGQYLNDVQVEQIELPVDINAEFVVPIYGDSMEPDYSSGDYIFVKPSVNLSDGDIGVFEYNGDAYIKQLIINKHDAFLRSLNPEYKDIPIDKNSDFRIIGEVVGKYSEK
ncbi:LexA family transcriptional regulator [Streptococcus pluranimalium]|uniref:LexA family transcriptional regulator n=1 Tax=Streptococcus pluranimalium TaxID=82348 RepID=UPI004046DEB4